MTNYIIILFSIFLLVSHSFCDELGDELSRELSRILENELDNIIPSDEQLQNIQGSGEADNELELLSETSTAQPSQETTEERTTAESTTTTTTMTTTTTPKPITTRRPWNPVCKTNVECVSDRDCGKGRCRGARLGTCNCRKCLADKPCEFDSDCGGLHNSCVEKKCQCYKALNSHEFLLFIDVMLKFCDQRKCSMDDTSECYGLPCNLGTCQC